MRYDTRTHRERLPRHLAPSCGGMKDQAHRRPWVARGGFPLWALAHSGPGRPGGRGAKDASGAVHVADEFECGRGQCCGAPQKDSASMLRREEDSLRPKL